MYKYINAIKLGYEEGIKDAIDDSIKKKEKKFKEKERDKTLSELYDIGYINSYTSFYKYIKNSLLKDRKI